MSKQPASLEAQQGVALVTVLFMFAISVVIMAGIIQKLDQDIDAYQAYFEIEQARFYALSGEEVARQLLTADLEESSGVDHLKEGWADEDLRIEMENGYIELQINDLQGKFNLNNLVDDNGKRDGNAVAALISLMKLLDISPEVFNTIPSQLGDWMDSNTGGQTADLDYLSIDDGAPYRPANARIADVSEMRLLLDMDSEQYRELQQKLWPYITVIPAKTPVNANTVSAEVLASLHTAIQLPSAENIVAKVAEQEKGYRDVKTFLKELPGNSLTEDEITVSSDYFEVRVRAKYGDHYAFSTALLYRRASDSRVELLNRNLSNRFIFESSKDYTGASDNNQKTEIEL